MRQTKKGLSLEAKRGQSREDGELRQCWRLLEPCGPVTYLCLLQQTGLMKPIICFFIGITSHKDQSLILRQLCVDLNVSTCCMCTCSAHSSKIQYVASCPWPNWAVEGLVTNESQNLQLPGSTVDETVEWSSYAVLSYAALELHLTTNSEQWWAEPSFCSSNLSFLVRTHQISQRPQDGVGYFKSLLHSCFE